jgi:hypothetical protein
MVTPIQVLRRFETNMNKRNKQRDNSEKHHHGINGQIYIWWEFAAVMVDLNRFKIEISELSDTKHLILSNIYQTCLMRPNKILILF